MLFPEFFQPQDAKLMTATAMKFPHSTLCGFSILCTSQYLLVEKIAIHSQNIFQLHLIIVTSTNSEEPLVCFVVLNSWKFIGGAFVEAVLKG